MSFAYHSNTFIMVKRIASELQAECTVLGSDLEAAAWIAADIETLKIARAAWALYRSPDQQAGYYDLADLVGVEAYLNAGPHLRRVLGGRGRELPRELISECIRGILQAETFFYQERGYASAKQFDDFWEEMCQGSCRYYSHLNQIEQQWMEWVGDSTRQYNLFNRGKTVIIQPRENEYILTASFIDSFHHLSIELRMNQEGIVTHAGGDYASAPDKICWENTAHLPNLVGRRLAAMEKKDIAALAGGPEGCNHLVDLLCDAAVAMAKV